MDIVHVLDSRGIGGIETHVEVTAKGLQRAGHRVRVIFLIRYEDAHPIEASLEQAGVPVSYASAENGLWSMLRRDRPDVVHSHGYKANLLVRGLCRILNIPTVASFHAGEAVSGKLRIYTSLDRWSSLLDTKIAISRRIAETLPGQSVVLDNFVDVPNATAPLTGNRIAFVGRLSHEKAPDRFCAMAERLDTLQADVYGDGPMRQGLEARYGERIRFHGAVSNIPMRLLNTDLVVMPSRQEGLPLTALEAMAHGVPVAATAVGGLPNLIEDGTNGFITLAETPFALEHRIADYFNLPESERQKIGASACQTIHEGFSTDAQIPKLLAIYRQAGARSRGGFHAIAA